MLLVGILGHANIGIAAGGMTLPHLLAVGEVIGGDAAASRKFIAAEADDDLVIRDDRGRRDGLAFVRKGVLDDPELLAGNGIERDDVAVQGAEHELAARIRQAAIHRIATGAGYGGLISTAGLGVMPHLSRMIRVGE